ncbi:MAG: hydroxyacid dehydrogenase [Proteobacteria bacterium]|nr:hydroxyacid dehydrogenase [Pseudomonadota bacterium]
MRKRVLLPTPMLDPAGEEALRKEVDVVDGRDFDAGQEQAAMAEVEGICGGIAAGPELMDRAPRLEVIGFPGSGFETIDVAAATERGIAVVNAAGAQYSAVAEHAIGLMLSLAKRIGYADRWLHGERRYPGREVYSGDGWPGFPHEIGGKTVGILGFGFIGRDLARKCRVGFDMPVLAYDPYYDEVEAARQGVELYRRRSQLPELICRCDFVVLSLPLSRETRHIVGEAELRAMRPGAFFINVSRGGTVDEPALVRALREGWIAGAGIDVFDPEPTPDDHAFFSMENTVLTPHIAGWVQEAMPRLSVTVAREMLSVLRGERPNRLANPEVWDAPQRRAREAP